MRLALVLDVSACMPWVCEDETTAASEEILDWALQGSNCIFQSSGSGKC